MEVKIYYNDYDKLRTTEYKQQKNSLKTEQNRFSKRLIYN